jgi:2-oxoglutarate dehydrogenase E1 component
MLKYPNLKELIWCQEEPMNQGAWYAKHHRLERLIKKGQILDAVARPSSPSPAVGYASKHAQQQKEVVNAALGIKE